jgi:2-phospho-L-lactate guanylyltransferase
MTLWAIVPVKPLRRGKSRLAGALSERERVDLNRILLERTLKTLIDLKEVAEVLVVSRDSTALALARAAGARTVQEDGAPSLNTALKRATVVAQVYASRGVLVIPADLPCLRGMTFWHFFSGQLIRPWSSLPLTVTARAQTRSWSRQLV